MHRAHLNRPQVAALFLAGPAQRAAGVRSSPWRTYLVRDPEALVCSVPPWPAYATAWGPSAPNWKRLSTPGLIGTIPPATPYLGPPGRDDEDAAPP